MHRHLGRPAAVIAAIMLLMGAAVQARPVRFELQPTSGSGQYIRAHDFLKCKTGGGNPWTCGSWTAVQHGDVRNLRGQFCVLARWEGGSTHRGSFVVPSGESGLKVILRPSNMQAMGACQ